MGADRAPGKRGRGAILAVRGFVVGGRDVPCSGEVHERPMEILQAGVMDLHGPLVVLEAGEMVLHGPLVVHEGARWTVTGRSWSMRGRS